MSYDGLWQSDSGTIFRVDGDEVWRRDGLDWVPVSPSVIFSISGLGGDVYTRIQDIQSVFDETANIPPQW